MARLAVPVAVRWGDLDAYGHVNNVAVLRLMEEARVAAFWHPGDGEPEHPTAVLHAGPGADTITVVAKHEVEYLAPFGHLRGGVVVELWIGNLGGASIDICYEIYPAPGEGSDDASPRRPFVRATSTLVMLDARTNAPRRLGEAEREAWAPYVEQPVQHRRRA